VWTLVEGSAVLAEAIDVTDVIWILVTAEIDATWKTVVTTKMATKTVTQTHVEALKALVDMVVETVWTTKMV
jgi:hypothetical protein